MTVSIVIPCYNAGQWVGQAIESAAAQGFPPSEIVVVDDGSTDHSGDVVARKMDEFPGLVRYYRRSNQGAPAARNFGFKQIRGDFVMFLDADDTLRADALEHLVDAATEMVDVVYGNACLVDQHQKFLEPKNQQPHSTDWTLTMIENAPITSSVMFRRSALSSEPWDETLPCQQDYAFNVDCAIRSLRFNFVDTTIASIRQHESPWRISLLTHRSVIAAQTASRLHVKFRSQLEALGELTTPRNRSLQYRFVQDAIMLWRFGRREDAQLLLDQVDREEARLAPGFRRLSYAGLTVAAGLRISHLAWLFKERFSRILSFEPKGSANRVRGRGTRRGTA